MPIAAEPGAPAAPGGTPPFRISQRISNRAIWAVAFFAAAVPPALVGMGVASTRGEEIAVGMPIALALWVLGALPMLTVSLFLTATLIGVLLV